MKLMPIHEDLQDVLNFWFNELTPKDWYSGDASVDTKISDRFVELHIRVAANEYWRSRTSSDGFLAEVIVLDQFSRNMFRGTPKAFAYDGQALLLSQTAIAAGHDKAMSAAQKQFLYMPFMHSESKVIHVEAMHLFEALGNQENLSYEKIHKDIIDRFGRYPHRNEVLGRQSTPAELDYLATNHESFF